MWKKKLLKYRSQAKKFHMMEVKSGLQTSLWHDTWCSHGRLYETLGERGFIDMGISAYANVAYALAHHLHRRHRLPFLNMIELEIDKIKDKGQCEEADTAMWRRPGSKHVLFL